MTPIERLKDLHEKAQATHPDTVRLEKLADQISGAGADRFKWFMFSRGEITLDNLRSYIDGLES